MTMIISGDGTISGLTAGGLPSATVTQATLATPVAGTGPAFSAYQSVAQSVANSTWTKISINAEEFDTASAYDSTTNYRFQPLVAGYYQISGGLGWTNAAAIVVCAVYKNGTRYKRGSQTGSASASGWDSQVSVLVYLNGSTDYVELYGYQASGSSQNTLTPDVDLNYFQGVLVRAA